MMCPTIFGPAYDCIVQLCTPSLSRGLEVSFTGNDEEKVIMHTSVRFGLAALAIGCSIQCAVAEDAGSPAYGSKSKEVQSLVASAPGTSMMTFTSHSETRAEALAPPSGTPSRPGIAVLNAHQSGQNMGVIDLPETRYSAGAMAARVDFGKR
jgi:hypothetical protein